MKPPKVQVAVGSVKKLLRRGALLHIANLLAKFRPGDVSSIISSLNDREQVEVFSILLKRHRKLAAESLNVLGAERGIELLRPLSSQDISEVLQDLKTDDAAVFISALPEETAQEVLQRMRVETKAEVQGLLQYEPETAGRIMSPNVFSLQEDMSVNEAIQAIQTSVGLEMVFYLYVVDDRHHLVGVVSLRQLLTVPPSTPLKKIMSTNVISVDTDTDQEEVARQVALYDLLAIPVTDHENKLVGVITVDDVIDVIEEEATEDIFHMAGVDVHDHVYTPVGTSVKRRLPWLGINLVTAFMAASVVALFEPTIARYSFLAVFLPVVAGMGGNGGTQTLTVIVRGLALGELSWENTHGALWKESLVGVSTGLAMGLVAGIAAYLWESNWMLGVIVGSAMIANMFVAGVTGSMIPLILKKLNIDPAIASGIILTTFTDIVGFFSFLGLASLLLRYVPLS